MVVVTKKNATCGYVPHNFDRSRDIVTLEVQDKAKVTDTKSGSFVIEQEVVETSRIDTQEYIDSFKDDVGIENVLRKFELTGDPSTINQRVRPTVPVGDDGKEAVQDYVNIPTNQEEAMQIAANARAAFKALPPELVNNRSFMEFAETCTEDELKAYIATLKKEGE